MDTPSSKSRHVPTAVEPVDISRVDEIARRIDELGFVVVPRVTDPQTTGALRAALLRALEEDEREFGGLPGKHPHLVVEMVRRGVEFVRLLENEAMHAVFRRMLGEASILYSFTSTVMPPGEHMGASAIHKDTPRFVPGYTTGVLMTLALDDFTSDNGATYYLPGSHRRAEPPPEEEFYRDAVRVERAAGDAVFFSNQVFHAGGPNQTSSIRCGLTIYACRPWMKQRFDYPRLVGDDILRELGPVGRRFLGFDARVPTCCEEFYVPPQERLYKAGQG